MSSALKWLHEQRNKKTAPLFEKEVSNMVEVTETNYPDPTKTNMKTDVAFAVAIKEGILSTDETAINWAGHYMFMNAERVWHEDNDGAEWRTRFNFKHIDTRNYLKFTIAAIFTDSCSLRFIRHDQSGGVQ